MSTSRGMALGSFVPGINSVRPSRHRRPGATTRGHPMPRARAGAATDNLSLSNGGDSVPSRKPSSTEIHPPPPHAQRNARPRHAPQSWECQRHSRVPSELYHGLGGPGRCQRSPVTSAAAGDYDSDF